MILKIDRIRRGMLRNRRDALFVFGDNMARAGYGGQARECRGEPNAVGIPTKWLPSNDPHAFFTDDDLEKVKPAIDDAFIRLAKHVADGGVVFVPSAGVGTGLADLPNRAPRIARYIERCIERLRVKR